MKLDDCEKSYLIFTFLFSFCLTCIILLIKIDCKHCSFIAIFFAVFFLTFYFYQPFLLCLDRLKSFVNYYSLEKKDFDIDYFLDWEYFIIGWVGTIFSHFILPFHKHYVLSGYWTFCGKLKDSAQRWWKDKRRDLIIIVLYIAISYIVYRARDKDKEVKKYSSGAADFILNALQLPDYFEALWYLGAYFPFLICQLRIEFDLFKSDAYYIQLVKNITNSLENDKAKIEKSCEHLYYISAKFIDDNIQKGKISDYLDFIKENKDNLKIKFEFEEVLEKKNEELEKEINIDNFIEKLTSAVRSLKKRFFQVLRKIYIVDILRKESEQKNCFCYCLFPFGMAFFGILVFFFEISLYAVEYKSLRTPSELVEDYIFSIFISFIYFSSIFYSVIRKNYLSEQNIYGIRKSDNLCLLNFTETISGLIEPVSFLFIGTKALGIFQLRDNMTFMETFDIPIVENIFIGLNFNDVYKVYIAIRLVIILSAFFLTLAVNKIEIKICCSKDRYLVNSTINDMNSDSVANNICFCKKS